MKRKKVLLLSLPLIICGCSKPEELTFINDPVLEYGEEIDRDAISEIVAYPSSLPDDVKIEIDGKEVKKDSEFAVGEHKLKLSGTRILDSECEVEIKDTQPPTIEQKETEIDVNSVSDPKELFTVEDPSEFEYTVNGTIDLSKAGEYKATVDAKDKYDNKSSKEFTITIRDYQAEEAQRQQEQAQREEAQRQQEQAEKAEEYADDAEDEASQFVAVYYNANIGVDGFMNMYTTDMGDSWVVQFPAKIDGQKHSFVVYVTKNSDGSAGAVSRVSMDGVQIK